MNHEIDGINDGVLFWGGEKWEDETDLEENRCWVHSAVLSCNSSTEVHDLGCNNYQVMK